MSIGWKCAYWMKMCLLNEKMPIDQKSVYWMKMCLPKGVYWYVITLYIGYQKVPIDRKCAYWLKMCILAENVSIE